MTDTEDQVTDEPAGLLSRWARNKARNQAEVATIESSSDDSETDESPPVEGAGEHDDVLHTGDTLTSEIAVESTAPDHVHADDMVSGVSDDVAADEELILTDEDMPALETLHAESDYSGFFNKGVSPELRKKALQHLFRMPKFNIRDGLNDYDEDYTYFEPLGDTITSDMRWHAARKEREAREAEELAQAREAEEALQAENSEHAAIEEHEEQENHEAQEEQLVSENTDVEAAAEAQDSLQQETSEQVVESMASDTPTGPTEPVKKNEPTALPNELAENNNKDKSRALT